MTKGRVGDLADAAVGRRRRALRRKRGTTLIEMVLYLTLVSVVMTFSLGLLREEQVRRERTAFAAELRQVTSASQAYVAANYNGLLNTLLNDTPTGQPMIAVQPVSTVVSAGFLPQGFAGTSNPQSFVDTLDYSLVMRAVRRSDPGDTTEPIIAKRYPETVKKENTTTFALFTPGTPGNPDVFLLPWIDRNPANDEIDLEVLLVTTGPDPCVIVPAVQGPRIASQAETMAAGYITGPGAGKPTDCPATVTNDPAWDGTFTAAGPFGAWTLPLEPYVDLELDGNPAVQAGRLASLIALQKRPALSEGAAVAGAGDSAFRCAGVTPNTPQHLACRQSALMYSGITFAAWDSDGNGTPDMRPGLENVHSISLAAPAAGSGAQIRNVLSLACGTGGATVSAANEINVDCPSTKLQGLVVSENASFDRDVSVDGAMTVGGAMTAASADVTGNLKLKGEDIEGWLSNSDVYTFPGGNAPVTVPKPVCPTGYSAKMAASLMSYEATDVRKQEVISTPTGASWKVDLKLTVGQTPFVLTSGTTEIPNPDGAKLLVQTWCS
ncbi:MAG: hypothetical protein LW715_08405 [Rhodobacter sp.]|nr:hypothetical protein [Rhodobacter sp.]